MTGGRGPQKSLIAVGVAAVALLALLLYLFVLRNGADDAADGRRRSPATGAAEDRKKKPPPIPEWAGPGADEGGAKKDRPPKTPPSPPPPPAGAGETGPESAASGPGAPPPPPAAAGRDAARRYVTGFVHDAVTRTPIAGAQVQEGGGATAVTGTDGAFRVAASSGGRQRFVASAQWYLPREQWSDVPDAPGAETQLDFELDRSGEIVGVVILPTGQPAGGAMVTACRPGGILAPTGSTSTGEDGRFRFAENLDPHDEYEVWASLDISHARLPSVKPNGREVRLKLSPEARVAYEPAELAPWLVEANDLLEEPIRSAGELAPCPATPGDEAGILRIYHPGRYALLAKVSGPPQRTLMSAPFVVRPGETVGPVRIDQPFVFRGAIRVRLRGADGMPVAGASVDLYFTSDFLRTPVTHTYGLTDEDGLLVIGDLGDGRYEVRAAQGERKNVARIRVDVVEGGTTDAELTLPAAPE